METSALIRLCIQACINTYEGNYGGVKKVFDNPVKFTVKHTEGHYAIQEDTLYIIFQGSHGRADWLDNFKFWHRDLRKTKPYGNIDTDIEIHTGFLEQYQLVRSLIHSVIKENPNISKIVVAGHSLGGALSSLCSVDINYNFQEKDITCITLGSPRAGNRAFVTSYNKRVPKTYRIVNGDDIVCKVPLIIMGFIHTSMKLLVGKKKWYKLFSIDAHYPNLYQKNYELFLVNGGKIPTISEIEENAA